MNVFKQGRIIFLIIATEQCNRSLPPQSYWRDHGSLDVQSPCFCGKSWQLSISTSTFHQSGLWCVVVKIEGEVMRVSGSGVSGSHLCLITDDLVVLASLSHDLWGTVLRQVWSAWAQGWLLLARSLQDLLPPQSNQEKAEDHTSIHGGNKKSSKSEMLLYPFGKIDCALSSTFIELHHLCKCPNKLPPFFPGFSFFEYSLFL